MSFLTPELLLVVVAAFAAGFVDSMVGGGGLIQLPVLFSAYPATPPAALLGTSKLAGIFGTTSAVARFARSIRIPWRRLLPLLVLALLGGLGGALTVSAVPPELFRPLVPLLLTAVLIYLLRRKDLGTVHQPREFETRHDVLAALLTVAIGFYDGFFGPGTGSFFMFVFIRLYGFDFIHSAACARLLNVATNAAALLCFSVKGNVLWAVGAAMAVSNVSGALLGTRVALRRGSGFVRRIFIVVVAVLIAKTAWNALRT